MSHRKPVKRVYSVWTLIALAICTGALIILGSMTVIAFARADLSIGVVLLSAAILALIGIALAAEGLGL